MSMKQCFADRQFLDDMTKPLVSGRLTFFVHDSNALADISTLEGDTYVQAQNPQILDETGRLQASLFMDLGVYDIKVEKYNGIDDSYEDFDWFEFGLDARIDQIGKTEVADIAELADLDPSVSSKVVTVASYPRRDYIWDPDAVDTADGGVVIGSDVTSEGRWLLLWDCPYLPSSVYGVEHGDITNINALFSYSRYIGSANIVTPPCILLEPGTYNLGNTYVCTKKLAIQPGTQFTGCIRVPCDVEIMGKGSTDTWIGNFYFDQHNCTAHSSWYANVEDFWQSGADTFVVDSENYFVNRTLSSIVDLTDKVVHGPAPRVSTYQNHAHFIVAPSTELPDMFFNPSLDCVRVSGDIGDNIFLSTGTWDPGRIVDGHRVQYDVAPDLDKFANADNWVATVTERKSRLGNLFNMSILDLQGRTLSNGIALNATNGFIGVRNGTVNGVISVFGQYCNMYNVVGTVLTNSAQGATVNLEKCNIVFEQYQTGLAQLVSKDSTILLSGNPGLDVSETALTIYGGTFQGFLGMSTPYVKTNNVSFVDVHINGSNRWKLNRLYMTGCFGDILIDMIPYAYNSEYLYEIYFTNNTLVGSGRIWFTGVFSQSEPRTDMAGNVKFGQCVIVNNAFYGGAGGVKMLREHPWTFTHFMNKVCGPWTYEGNYGDCPVVKPARIGNTATFSQGKKTTGLTIEWLISDNTFNAWAPYQDSLSQGIPDQAQAGDGVEDSMAEVVDSVGGTAYPKNIVFGWSCGLPLPSDLMDEDENNQCTEYLCLTWDLPIMDVPNGITRFP